LPSIGHVRLPSGGLVLKLHFLACSSFVLLYSKKNHPLF
jgi:hypothetical protein